jgi:predicted NBD/HSP70 family sugar kinase
VREQAVVDLLRQAGPMSRAAIARHCRISKPGASHLVEALLQADLLIERGLEHQGTGRPGRLVAFNGDAGFVIGMDVGGTTIRAVLANLDGTVVRTVREPTEQGSADALVDQIARLVRSLSVGPGARGRVLEVAIGTPGVVDPSGHHITIAPNLRSLEEDGFLDRLELAVDVPLTILNDVNAAALGEFGARPADSLDSLVYVSIGTGLGFGLVVDRRLHHGTGGRAGELGLLPYPPGSESILEDRLSGAGVRRRHLDAGGLGNPEDAFLEAEAGLEPGISVVSAFLDDLSWTLTVITTLFDPDLIVLGGGIGLRCAPHLDTVRGHVARASGFSTDIAVARLGDDAGLTGAVASALEPARSVDRWLKGGPMATAP